MHIFSIKWESSKQRYIFLFQISKQNATGPELADFGGVRKMGLIERWKLQSFMVIGIYKTR